MRLILEGACGTGKSTLARVLSSQADTPIYRPFRGADEHITSKTIDTMADLGLSVNDWEEDVYVSDVLSVLKPDAILDRSMPSALTWNSSRNCALLPNQLRLALRLWTQRIVAWGAVLVLVECEPALRNRRCPDRGGAWEANGIRDIIRQVSELAPLLPVWSVKTDVWAAEYLAVALTERVMYGKASPLIESPF